MKRHRIHINIVVFFLLMACSVFAQESIDQQTQQAMQKSDAMLSKFSRKCERRTKKAERRFARYERKMGKDETQDAKPEAQNSSGLGKEPLMDSMKLVYGFADHAGISNEKQSSNASVARAQQQLNVTQRTKSSLLQRKEHYKAQVKEHPEYVKWLRKMEKERYYYTAQINEYRKSLRDPDVFEEKLMEALRRDPRWSEFAATLPTKPQDPAKMQPRQMVQQMMKSQAAAIDPDPAKLLSDAKKKSGEKLGNLSNQASSFGNLDNAAQMPKFTPNPYKTKSFWNRIDVGFNLQFDNRTNFMPSTGVAGAQVSFNFDPRFSAGLLANYRFGMGEIKNIQFSHGGAGYGAFANYKVWKRLGLQAGYERNWRAKTVTGETQHTASWTDAALAGLTWEYGIGKKVKATMGVFYDFLHKQHTPQTNAVLWRMGWKI